MIYIYFQKRKILKNKNMVFEKMNNFSLKHNLKKHNIY